MLVNKKPKGVIKILATVLLIIIINLLVTSNVMATTRTDRLNGWWSQSGSALFIHWGAGIGREWGDGYTLPPLYASATEFEQAAINYGWNANKWVEAAQKLHANYIILASCHPDHGYIKTWRSNIPGTQNTSRDFLGELISAAHNAGIKVLVYMCPNPAKHYYFGIEWMDKQAYSNYKNDPNIDITTIDGWGQYSYDVIMELMNNYTLDGFWFDGWDNWDKWEQLGLLETIHQINPNLIIVRNDWGYSQSMEDIDVMALENNSKYYSPYYDYPSGNWVKPDIGSASCFACCGNWWYTGNSPYENSDKTLTKRYITSRAGSYNIEFGIGPTIGGDFVEGAASFLNEFDTFMNWAGESLYGPNIKGGGYNYGGLQPGDWNDGAYGVTTINIANNVQYIHLLFPPTGIDKLIIPDCGYSISSISNLKTGESLAFSQSNGKLTITAPNWEDVKNTRDGVMIFKVIADGPYNIISHASMSVSANSEDPLYPASNIIDNNYYSDYYSSANSSMPIELSFNLGGSRSICGLMVNQCENLAVNMCVSGPSDLTNSRIKDYEIYVSNDGVNWGSAAATGTLKNQRGVQYISFPEVSDKMYVKFKILNNYAGNGIVKIADINIVSQPIGLTYVNDNNNGVTYSSGWNALSQPGYYNDDCHYNETANSYCEFTFTGTEIRYICKKVNNRGYADIYIDGVKDATVDCYSPTEQFQSEVYRKTGLTYGTHTIRVVNTGLKNQDSTGTCIDIDEFVYQSPPTELTSINDNYAGVTYSSGWNVLSQQSGYYNNDCHYSETADSYCEFTFTGTEIRYICKKVNNRGYADIYIDGVKDATVDCYSPTEQFQSEVYRKTGLTYGTHTIRVVNTGLKNQDSTGTCIDIDKFVYQTIPSELTNVNDNYRVTYSSGWNTLSQSGYYNNDCHYSETADSYCEFTFTGTEIRYICKKVNNRGYADIYIDGVKDATVDCYSPTEQFQSEVYRKTGLTYGTHTIRVVNTGLKNQDSTGICIDIDEFVYQ